MTRTARTVSRRWLEAHVPDGERVELPGPEGGWATATINGRLYRARVAPAGHEGGHLLIGSICSCGGWAAQCGNDIPGQWADHVRAEGPR